MVALSSPARLTLPPGRVTRTRTDGRIPLQPAARPQGTLLTQQGTGKPEIQTVRLDMGYSYCQLSYGKLLESLHIISCIKIRI